MAIQFDAWETSITNELEQINNAVYGKDVRGAIHDGLEKGFDKANSAASYAKDVKQQYDGVLFEWNSDPSKDPEVIAARGGLPQLEDRLEATDAQLAQKTIQVSVEEPSQATVWYEDKGEAPINFESNSGVTVQNAELSESEPTDTQKLWFDEKLGGN
ncbi:MAG: hypothetical protein L0J63_08055 [Tetragenococcus koreensis]|nr:hypothetical protein [Tetragenococcus koreensis]